MSQVPKTNNVCPNTTVTTTCGGCADTNCGGNCAKTGDNQYCADSCNFSNATVETKACKNNTDMFGYQNPNFCCYQYTWNDASGNNGICSAGTKMFNRYTNAIYLYLGINLKNMGLLEMSRFTFLAVIALFLTIYKM